MLQRLQTASQAPYWAFYLPDYLEGELAVSGHFNALFGGLVRKFTGQALGTWQEATFVLDESLQFDDGQREERTWRFTFDEDGNFTSTCADVVGCGTGWHMPNGCTHTYLFTLPVGHRGLTVRIRETFAQGDEGTLLYRAKLSKWGLPVGEVRMECWRR